MSANDFETRIQKAFMYLAFVFFGCIGIIAVAGTAFVVYLILTNMRSW